MFHMIGHIIFGLIVGTAVIFLVPGPRPGGWIAIIVLARGAALVGGWLGRAMGWYRPGHPAGFFMALLGAVLLLVAYTVPECPCLYLGHSPLGTVMLLFSSPVEPECRVPRSLPYLPGSESSPQPRNQ